MIEMKEALMQIKEKGVAEIRSAQSLKDLEAIKVKYLGKKGELTQILKGMGKLTAEERPVIGLVDRKSVV